jgi:uncharacterized protein (TIGR02996 family)
MLEAVRQCDGDLTTLLVACDWLDEHGNPSLAEECRDALTNKEPNVWEEVKDAQDCQWWRGGLAGEREDSNLADYLFSLLDGKDREDYYVRFGTRDGLNRERARDAALHALRRAVARLMEARWTS